jgi:hypothetical protein
MRKPDGVCPGLTRDRLGVNDRVAVGERDDPVSELVDESVPQTRSAH